MVIKTEKYKDVGAFVGTEGIENIESAKEKIILNSINVLMKRGVKGLYLYASDERLRKRLLELQNKNDLDIFSNFFKMSGC